MSSTPPSERLLVKPHPDDEAEVYAAFESEDGNSDLVVTPEQLEAWAETGALPWEPPPG